jgi:AcrR family transcriptional regulator
MKQVEKPRPGRPWSFDRDKAVETAIRLFWHHGYEGISVGDLTKKIGVAPPSLYAAFGSKAGLYREAVDRYEETLGCIDADAVKSATSLAGAVRLLLEGAVRAVTNPGLERGCLISSGMITCHPDNDLLARDAAARREAMKERIVRILEPFAGSHDMSRLGRHLAAVMQGISIQARDGVQAEVLNEIIDDVVSGVEAQGSVQARPQDASSI